MFRSPNMAKLAVTPPVVGSAITEMYGTFASSSSPRPDDILANCIRLVTPSIMRAPPDDATITSGCPVASERSTARAMVSPTTHPILPPMKEYSITLSTTLYGPIVPRALMIASFRPVSLRAFSSRAA